MNIINTSTETLKDLISSVKWCDVYKSLLKYYPDCEESSLFGFEYVFFELQELMPDKNGGNKIIVIDKIYNDIAKQEWYDVSGYDGTTNWAMDFSPWEYWLSLPIDPDTLNLFTKEDIVALCLYEMTWDGFTQEDIRAKAKALFHRDKEN